MGHFILQPFDPGVFDIVVFDEASQCDIASALPLLYWTGELCRRDPIRNQRLFELGYDVLRFWVYEVRDDLPSCLKRIEAWLAR